MLKTLSFIMRLRNTYRANSVIFALRSLPFAKKVLPATLYSNKTIKMLANIIAAFIEISLIFIGKLIYIIAIFFILDYIYTDFGINIDVVHFFIFSTLAGTVANNRFDNATRDSYYAIFNLKLPARDYAVTEMAYFLFKTAIGFVLFSLLGGLLIGFNSTEMVLIPPFVVTAKLAVMPLLMSYSQRNIKVMGRSYVQLAIGFVLVAIGLVTGAFGIEFPGYSLLVATVVSFILSIFSLRYILNYHGFKEFYRKLFVTDIAVIAPNADKVRKDTLAKGFHKQITTVAGITSDKKGFAYFNDLFVKRHRKMLSRTAVVITIILTVLSIGILTFCLIYDDFSAQINSFILNDLPFFLFVMYFINCGNRVTMAMYANCDGAMLRYGFYRKPSSLLNNFTQRLLSIIKINLMPAIVIAVALPLLLFATGGADRSIDYLLVPVSIVAISIFFSVHSMVLYYLLQPYNEKMEVKSPLFSIANFVTYFVCYLAIGKQLPLLLFCIAVIAFCIIYIIVALILAYRLAPKTFRLKS